MTAASDAANADEIERGLRLQASQCRALGADFTATIIEAAADDFVRGGALAEQLSTWRGEPMAAALGLRLAAAFHYIANIAPDSALGASYRLREGEPEAATLGAHVAAAADIYCDLVASYVARPVQTNETRRAAALIVGFLDVAKTADMPIDLFEIGAGAGFLLNWDQYHYDFGAFQWGSVGLQLAAEWKGAAPAWPVGVEVRSRRGCDLNPIDYADDDAVERAAAYIWAEQIDRRASFLEAVAKARAFKPVVDSADAGAWLAAALPSRAGGGLALVYHSVMAQYLTPVAAAEVAAAIEDAARAASRNRPFAYLTFEPDEDGPDFAVDLTMWPGGEKRRLAYAHPHGAWVAPCAATN